MKPSRIVNKFITLNGSTKCPIGVNTFSPVEGYDVYGADRHFCSPFLAVLPLLFRPWIRPWRVYY